MPKKQLQGEVVSDKMQKTIVVRVEKCVYHPKYKKRYLKSKKYKVCDNKEQYKAGDKIIIEECKPISKNKKWKVAEKIKKPKIKDKKQILKTKKQ